MFGLRCVTKALKQLFILLRETLVYNPNSFLFTTNIMGKGFWKKFINVGTTNGDHLLLFWP